MAHIGICPRGCHGVNRVTKECPTEPCGVHGLDFSPLHVLDSDFDEWARTFNQDAVRKRGDSPEKVNFQVGQVVRWMTR